jgi:hypothetical protein
MIKMKNAYYLWLVVILTFQFCERNQKQVRFENKEFEHNLIEFLRYIDSSGYKQDFDYIIVECSTTKDSTQFSIYKSAGAYSMIYHLEQFVDYFNYKGHNILLLGHFPNNIVKILKNKKINVVEDIVKAKYPQDYNDYLQNPRWVKPIQSDEMEMVLTFYKDKFISCKHNYF